MKVVFTQEAERDLERLARPIAARIAEKIMWLADHFYVQIPQPLGGNFKGFFKLRVGDWRVLYEVEYAQNLLVIHLIDHRSKIYMRRHL